MTPITIIRTKFQRHQLWAVRLGWMAVFFLTLGMIAANLPHVYTDTRTEWQVGEAMTAAMQIFSTGDAFIYTIIMLRFVTLSVFVLTALFLAWRKWNDWFSLYISATLLLLGYFFGSYYNVDLIRYPAWLEGFFPAIRAVAPSLTLISMLLIFYLFPDGRFTPRWLAWFTIPATVFTLLVFFETFFKHIGWLPEPVEENEWGWYLFVFSIFITAAIGLAGQIYRYRRVSNAEQRQQTKWVLLGLASLIVSPWLAMVTFYLFPTVGYAMRQFINLFVGSTIPLLLPLTIAFSILRYRLWEVDIWINRAVVYGGLTAVILLLYGFSIGLISVLVPTQESELPVFLGLIVVLFVVGPLRRLLQRGANQLLPFSQPDLFRDEADSGESGSPSVPLRLAYAIWIAAFLYFLWIAIERIRLSRLILSIGEDYLVQESLKLFPDAANGFVQYTIWLRVGVTAVYWVTALLIFWKKRHDWVAFVASFIFLTAPFGLILSGTDTPVSTTLSFAGLILAALFPFFFPDGRLIPQSWRVRFALILSLFLASIIAYNLFRFIRPDYEPGEWAYGSLMVTVGIIMAAGIGSQIYRFRVLSSAIQRQQTKWILLGFSAQIGWVLWLLFWLTGLLNRLGLTEPQIALAMLYLTMVSSAVLPVTFTFSILRYRLWEVDIWLNRTAVFGGLTLLVAAIYILTVGLMSTLVQTGGSVVLSVLATGLIAVLFNPLRQRLQSAVNRLMYGERDDPVSVLTALGKRLEEPAVPSETLPALVETIAQTLKLPYVAITAGDGSGAILAETSATSASQIKPFSFPLVYQSETIGRLLVSPRTPGEGFNPAEMNLLQTIARQAGTAVYAGQLTTDLQRSRERLVTTREEERRRIRRDLHDGLGPQLATMSLKVDAARNYLERDTNATAQLLGELKGEIQNAIGDIRRLVHDLRPPALDQLGLVPALKEFATSQNGHTRLDIAVLAPESLPPLPAAVEVAAYRIALEAMTNTIRHAQAKNCQVFFEVNGELFLEIRDDGIGLPIDYQVGVGLSSMRERAAELGGDFEITSTKGNGTVVAVRLPLE